jgi:hypothetical protein
MATIIPIQATANQSFTTQLGDDRYALTLKLSVNCMVMSIERNEVVIIEGTRVLAGEPVIPYHYREAGNFLLTTQDDELPDWQQFNITQFLIFLSAAEIEAIIAGS